MDKPGTESVHGQTLDKGWTSVLWFITGCYGCVDQISNGLEFKIEIQPVRLVQFNGRTWLGMVRIVDLKETLFLNSFVHIRAKFQDAVGNGQYVKSVCLKSRKVVSHCPSPRMVQT